MKPSKVVPKKDVRKMVQSSMKPKSADRSKNLGKYLYPSKGMTGTRG